MAKRAWPTLAEPIEDIETLFNPNVVKVVSDINGLALTFSRSTLALGAGCLRQSTLTLLPEGVPYRRHIGIYAYRAGFLHDFVSWGPCWLENTESLEQLRAPVARRAYPCRRCAGSAACRVSIPAEDLERVRRLLGA